MKTTVEYINDSKPPSYPYLAIYKGDIGLENPCIVLFLSKNESIGMTNSGGWSIGFKDTGVLESQFCHFNGKLTLSN